MTIGMRFMLVLFGEWNTLGRCVAFSQLKPGLSRWWLFPT